MSRIINKSIGVCHICCRDVNMCAERIQMTYIVRSTNSGGVMVFGVLAMLSLSSQLQKSGHEFVTHIVHVIIRAPTECDSTALYVRYGRVYLYINNSFTTCTWNAQRKGNMWLWCRCVFVCVCVHCFRVRRSVVAVYLFVCVCVSVVDLERTTTGRRKCRKCHYMCIETECADNVGMAITPKCCIIRGA